MKKTLLTKEEQFVLHLKDLSSKESKKNVEDNSKKSLATSNLDNIKNFYTKLISGLKENKSKEIK